MLKKVLPLRGGNYLSLGSMKHPLPSCQCGVIMLIYFCLDVIALGDDSTSWMDPDE